MLKKSKPLIVEKLNPFVVDKLGHCREFGEFLGNVILNSDGACTIAIDGKWGTGKSTFLRMLRTHLENLKVPSLFFNSWENDYVDDPLAALIAELEKQSKASPFPDASSGAIRSAVSAVKRKGKKLLLAAGAIGIKVATAGVLTQEEVAEIVSPEIAKGITDGFQKLAEKQIEDYEKKSKTVEGFKEALRDLVKAANQESGDGVSRPIVFFIDELDRCRPDHAIRILERVKHLFDVDGIVFVFAVHQGQLAAAIKAIYGESFDSQEYLKRFFDVSVKLPIPSRKSYCGGLFEFFMNDALKSDMQKNSSLRTATLDLIDAFQLDLRAVERVVRGLSLISRGIGRGEEMEPILQPFFASLAEGWPIGYEKFREGQWSGATLIQELKSNSPAKAYWQSSDKRLAAYVDAYLVAWDFPEDRDGNVAVMFAKGRLTSPHTDSEEKRWKDIIEYLTKWRPTHFSVRVALTRSEQLRQIGNS